MTYSYQTVKEQIDVQREATFIVFIQYYNIQQVENLFGTYVVHDMFIIYPCYLCISCVGLFK